MRVILDTLELDDCPDGLADAIEVARTASSSANRVIVELYLDDHFLAVEDLPGLVEAGCPAEVLRCVTEDPLALVQTTFDQAVDVLDELAKMHVQASDFIQEGQTVEALSVLNQVLALWSQIKRCVEDGTALAGINLNEMITENGNALEGALGGLADRLGSMRQAVENDDLVTLSDCLGYEMGEITAQWQDLLVDLRSRLVAPTEG